MLRRLFAVGLVVYCLMATFHCDPARAYSEAEVKKASEQAVRKIYDHLVAKKETIKVFSAVADYAPKLDELGWPYFEYSYTLPDGSSFYLLIRGLQSTAVDYHRRLDGYREYVNNVLNVKLMVYVNSVDALGSFDVFELVKMAATTMYPEGDNNRQLRLELTTEKKVFERNEKIEFGLALRNEGSVALRLRRLDEGSVTCFFNGLRWGVEEVSNPRDAILLPGDAFRKNFVIRGEKKGPLEIRCTYGLRFMGDQPTASTMVEVQ